MENMSEIDNLITKAEKELVELENKHLQVLKQIKYLKNKKQEKCLSVLVVNNDTLVTNHSSQEEKITLFRKLFRGREDVYSKRFESTKTGKSGYQPACNNEWVKGVCYKPKIKCVNCDKREYLPLNNEVIRNHLSGSDFSVRYKKEFSIGVYPLLSDETCWFIAVDFDKKTWMKDVSVYLEICKNYKIPAILERSRSGNGGHVWIFFVEPISANLARKLGSYILTEAMEYRPEIGLDSYDRLFPSQDTIPKGGFGNLIALPLQKIPRENENSVFIDENFTPYEDQWAFLSSIKRMNRYEVETIVCDAVHRGRVIGVKMIIDDEDNIEPWKLPPSGKREDIVVKGPFPEKIKIVLSNQIYIEKQELSPSLKNRLIRLAAFQNPEFYRAQAMRLPTFNKPRIISCCDDYDKYIGIPRGCLDEVIELLKNLNIKYEVIDEQFAGVPINMQFNGNLRLEQQIAADSMLSYNIGVISAATAFGKTVIASYMISQRAVNTLILVHRRQLLDQWVARLSNFLGIESTDIGYIGGGKNRITKIIDVGMIQSLSKKGIVNDIVGEYGHIVVDECHHVSARSFEIVVRQSKAKYITGLSATVTRKDGQHPIIFMQCGPIRYKTDDRKQAEIRPFTHKVIVRNTNSNLLSITQDKPDLQIHEVYTALINDEKRNTMIIEDVLQAVRAGRSPVLLTERREHLAYFINRLTPLIDNVIVLRGGMGRKQRRKVIEQIKSIEESEKRIIIATGRYLGEGFDDARLDTLFLTFPISWRGTLAQYAGRLHRLYDMKKEVIIYDYVDFDVPILAKMYQRRCRGYNAIGYKIA